MSTPVVVDASAALKWVINEPGSEQANALLSDLLTGVVPLFAPEHLVGEIANGLRKRVAQRILSADDAFAAFDAVLALELEFIGGRLRTLCGRTSDLHHCRIHAGSAYRARPVVRLTTDNGLPVAVPRRPGHDNRYRHGTLDGTIIVWRLICGCVQTPRLPCARSRNELADRSRRSCVRLSIATSTLLAKIPPAVIPCFGLWRSCRRAPAIERSRRAGHCRLASPAWTSLTGTSGV